MNEIWLSFLVKIELNKCKLVVMLYEIIFIDLEVMYLYEIILIGDIVRVKYRDFNLLLYVEVEVIVEEYNIILENSIYIFG